jgi:hypothetical protein
MISNAYHEFTDLRPMLRHIREALKPGGKLVVLEAITPKMLDRSRDEQVKVHELASAIVKVNSKPQVFVKWSWSFCATVRELAVIWFQRSPSSKSFFLKIVIPVALRAARTDHDQAPSVSRSRPVCHLFFDIHTP